MRQEETMIEGREDWEAPKLKVGDQVRNIMDHDLTHRIRKSGTVYTLNKDGVETATAHQAYRPIDRRIIRDYAVDGTERFRIIEDGILVDEVGTEELFANFADKDGAVVIENGRDDRPEGDPVVREVSLDLEVVTDTALALVSDLVRMASIEGSAVVPNRTDRLDELKDILHGIRDDYRNEPTESPVQFGELRAVMNALDRILPVDRRILTDEIFQMKRSHFAVLQALVARVESAVEKKGGE